jgi:O-antigen/teichoic acid export membrane protein
MVSQAVASLPVMPRPNAGSVGSSIARGALAILRTQPLTWGASLLTIALVPSLLGAEAFGQYTVAITIVSIASTAVGLGIPDYLVRRVAQQPEAVERDMGTVLLVTMTTALVGVLVLGLSVPLMGFSLGDNRLLYVALIGLLAVPLQGALLSSLRGLGNHSRFAWSNAATVVVWAVVGVLVLWAGASVVTYAAIGAVVTIATTLVAFKLSGLRPARPALDFSVIREFVRGGLPFLGCTLTQIVASSIDRVILGALVPSAEVGWYAAASRIVYIPVFIPMLLATPLFAVVGRNTHAPPAVRRAVAESLRVLLLLIVPLSAGLVVAAPIVPDALHWPSDFQSAVPLMQILSISIPVMALNMVLVTVLMALGGEGRWARASVLIAVLNAVMNVACIPWFDRSTGNGAIGASVITLVTEILMFAAVVKLLPSDLLELKVGWIMGRVVLAGIAAALVGAWLLPIALPLAAVIGGLVYLLATLGLQVLRPEDIRQLTSRRWLSR